MNSQSKSIKKTKLDWRKEPPTPNDKLRWNYALAAYLIDSNQAEELPAAGIATVRAIIPFIETEDPRWASIIPHKVTTSGYPIYKDLGDVVRNTLNSSKELRKHLNYVKARMKQQALEDDEAEDEEADGHQTEQDDGNNQIMKENQSGESTPSMKR